MTPDQKIEVVRVFTGMAGVALAAVILAALLIWSWIGRGDADTNGDPERDAGKEK